MNYLTKSFTKTYISSKLVDINESIEDKLFYVAGSDCRELIGIVHFLWVVDYINDKQREEYNDTIYALKSICERNTDRFF